jgi:hypothetical protein
MYKGRAIARSLSDYAQIISTGVVLQAVIGSMSMCEKLLTLTR